MIETVGGKNDYVLEGSQLAHVDWWETTLALRVRFLSDSDELAKGPGSQESGHFEELMMIGSHDSKSLVWKGAVENDRNLLVKPAALLKPQRQVWEYRWEYC